VLGRPVEITLYYKVLAPIDRAWRVFVHMREKRGGGGWHNADHEPIGGRCALSTLQPGDFVVDRFTTTLDDVVLGAYELRVGLFTGYAPQWQNMPLSDAPAEIRSEATGVKLATLTVTPP
jgi:hypothetical protein